VDGADRGWDRVRVRADGDSAAARKYAGWHGRVGSIAPDTTKATIYVCVDGNHALETAFEERDVLTLDEQEGSHFAANVPGRDRGAHWLIKRDR
jgi:hypothetical protein